MSRTYGDAEVGGSKFHFKRGIVNENGDESFRGKRHAAFVSPPEFNVRQKEMTVEKYKSQNINRC